MKLAIIFALLWLVAVSANAQDRVRYTQVAQGIVKETRTPIPRTGRYWNGRYVYTDGGQQWSIRKETITSSHTDWRDTFLKLLDQDKERASFQQAISAYTGTSYSSSASSAYYPSAVGSTVGGFTAYSHSRYGSTLDLNRANELAQEGMDQFARYSSDNQRRAAETFEYAGQLQQLSTERLGAVAELTAQRETIQAMGQSMQAMYAGLAEAIRAAKPPPGESHSYQSGTTQTPPTGPVPSDPGPPPSGPPSGPPQGEPVATGLLTKYCGQCHGQQSNAPSGGYYLYPGMELAASDFGIVALRLAPDAPAKTGGGRVFAMPPPEAPQPSVDERRQIVNEVRQLVRFE